MNGAEFVKEHDKILNEAKNIDERDEKLGSLFEKFVTDKVEERVKAALADGKKHRRGKKAA